MSMDDLSLSMQSGESGSMNSQGVDYEVELSAFSVFTGERRQLQSNIDPRQASESYGERGGRRSFSQTESKSSYRPDSAAANEAGGGRVSIGARQPSSLSRQSSATADQTASASASPRAVQKAKSLGREVLLEEGSFSVASELEGDRGQHPEETASAQRAEQRHSVPIPRLPKLSSRSIDGGDDDGAMGPRPSAPPLPKVPQPPKDLRELVRA